jgi:hypothetical protein
VTGPRETYDAMAADYVAHAEAHPYTALYEAPGLRALIPAVAGRRVLRPDGVFAMSTHQPAMDAELSGSGDYFATELLCDRWLVGGREREVRFWHRPLSRMFREIADAGFRVDELSEPPPLPEVKERFPDVWERLTTKPHFLFLRLVPR